MTSCNSVQQGKHAEKKVISEYTIQGFKIIIHEEDGIVYYTAEPLFDFQKDPLLFAELSALVNKNKDRLGKEILRFDDLVDTIKSVCMWKVLEIDGLEIDPEVFTELFIYRLIKLDRLIPALLDHYVNEIYMDQKGSALYLDHQTFGRCNTNVILDEEELEALITRIKLEHPITVSAKKPSLKIEFRTQEFHSRISMDFPPLSPNGPTFNIRKLKRKPLELLDLINLNTLPTSLGSYLVEAVINRQNITIIGEPNAGKTTLANAIDLYTPKHWRKIAIEDAIESTNQASMGFKHLSIQVDSFESNKSNHTKTAEILKLLHRSPDWIYLGEIQSREHTQAMFEALNAGLKGIQTAHSDSVEKILRRWENLHKIARSDFLSLDIIIIMRREITKSTFIRKIVDVYEVNPNNVSKENDYGFLTKVYDEDMNENQMFQIIKNKSRLSSKINSILERNHFFRSMQAEKWGLKLENNNSNKSEKDYL